VDQVWVAVVAAGAGLGVAGTWLTDRLRERQRATVSDSRALQAKLHEFELRIVRLETAVGFYSKVGRQRKEDGHVPEQG
jgi:hypothetical protein